MVVNSSIFFVWLLGFYVYKNMSSANKASLLSFWAICLHLCCYFLHRIPTCCWIKVAEMVIFVFWNLGRDNSFSIEYDVSYRFFNSYPLWEWKHFFTPSLLRGCFIYFEIINGILFCQMPFFFIFCIYWDEYVVLALHRVNVV